MKKILKKILSSILNFLIYFIPIKKFDLKNEKIVILLCKPLGIGDLVILSPFVSLIEKNFSNKVYILSEYDEFINFRNVKWINPSNFDKKVLEESIVISPTFTFNHLKYILRAKYFLGYFFSNKFVSNIAKLEYNYDPIKEHYLDRTYPILDFLKITYNKLEFNYPSIITKEYSLPINNYIAIAPYSIWDSKQYPMTKYFELISLLLNITNYNIILVGSNSDKEVAFNIQLERLLSDNRILNRTGKTSLPELSFILEKSCFYIGNDSGPSNIAYINSSKVMSFFGPVNFNNILPKNNSLREKILVMSSSDECSLFPCYNGFSLPICKKVEKYLCLNRIKLDKEQLVSFIES